MAIVTWFFGLAENLTRAVYGAVYIQKNKLDIYDLFMSEATYYQSEKLEKM